LVGSLAHFLNILFGEGGKRRKKVGGMENYGERKKKTQQGFTTAGRTNEIEGVDEGGDSQASSSGENTEGEDRRKKEGKRIFLRKKEEKKLSVPDENLQ